METEKVGNPQETVVEDDPRAPRGQQVEPPQETTQTTEISTAADREDEEVPERYRGKSVKEIAQMHMEAEKVIGRQGQRLGEYKGILTPHVEFDDDGRVVAYKQPQKPQPVATPQSDEIDAIEKETGVPRQAIEKIESRFRNEMMRNLQPIAEKLFDNDLKDAKREIFGDSENFPNAKDWEKEIDAELNLVPPNYRPRFVREKYLVVAGRKSIEARKKAPPVKPPAEPKKPFAEGAGKPREEAPPQEYDPVAEARKDAQDREKLRGSVL